MMKWMRGSVEDERGKCVVLYRWYRGKYDKEVSFRERKSRSAVSWKYFVIFPCALVVQLIALMVCAFSPRNLLNGPRLSTGVFYSIGALLVAEYVMYMFVMTNKQRAQATANACLRHRLCPGCGYSIRDLPTDELDCVICPECDSVWKLSRPIGSPGAANTVRCP
ncbi:MAG: hypothetical protein H6815_01790 [Phycisphaeraceae bacterium]|nr:hypothetical protein [Phycisphaerales bacterium]MCB9859160.1 hypothetical protein [Phycisphaeraceae bacterium]